MGTVDMAGSSNNTDNAFVYTPTGWQALLSVSAMVLLDLRGEHGGRDNARR
jgi:hypothetical protein